MTKLLEVENLYTSFLTLSKKVSAVRGVSFHLEEGEALAIVGESGCGKSVTARSITRLLPPISSRIEKGRILYRGEDLLLKKEKEIQKIRGKEIGMIFQDPMTSLNPTMRIGEQVIEGYALHHPDEKREQLEERALKIFHQVGMSEGRARLMQYPHELSGGMRQRVMIALAMISSPKILIADEPTTALDVTIQAQILDLLKNLQEQKGMSIIFITHDLSIVASFCTRVIVMYAGEIVESAPVAQLFSQPKHPYTRRLLNSIPHLDSPVHKRLCSIEGSPPDLSAKIQGCAFSKRCPEAAPLCHVQKPPNYSTGPGCNASCWLANSPRSEVEEST